jgi:hypothetical protein
MSQYSVKLTPGNLPPIVPTSFTADDATIATPVANNLNLFSSDVTDDNANGIQTTASGATFSIELTNRFGGNVTTTNATDDDSVSLDLGATPGVYTFDIQIAGFDVTDGQAVGYSIFGTVRTTGAAAVLIGTPDKIVNEEVLPVNISAVNANLVVSGNLAVVRLSGIAATTINWRVLATYVFVS